MAFHEYPYTDFHEMNLDWVIKKVKELAAAWAETSAAWQTQQEAFESLKNFVNDYFDNLDVQEEINNKLDAMEEDGSLMALIAPYVDDMLNIVTPEMFGAKGDDLTDDSAAFLDAISSGNNVFLRANTTYRIGNAIVINGAQNLNIFGNNATLHLDYSIHAFELLNCDKVTISGLNIRAERNGSETPPSGHTRQSSLGSNCDAYFIVNSSNLVFRDISCNGMYHDFFVRNSDNENYKSENILIDNWNSEDASMPLYGNKILHMTIVNSHVSPAEEMGDGDHILYIGQESRNLIVDDCTFAVKDRYFGDLITLHSDGGDVESQPKEITIYNSNFTGNGFISTYTSKVVIYNSEFTQYSGTRFSFSSYSEYNNYSEFYIHDSTFNIVKELFSSNTTKFIGVYNSRILYIGNTTGLFAIDCNKQVEIVNNYFKNIGVLYSKDKTNFNAFVSNNKIVSDLTGENPYYYIFSIRVATIDSCVLKDNLFILSADYRIIYNGSSDCTNIKFYNNYLYGGNTFATASTAANGVFIGNYRNDTLVNLP